MSYLDCHLIKNSYMTKLIRTKKKKKELKDENLINANFYSFRENSYCQRKLA